MTLLVYNPAIYVHSAKFLKYAHLLVLQWITKPIVKHFGMLVVTQNYLWCHMEKNRCR